MSRPDPIEYAERLYAAIRDANFSPISFLAFGNAVKDGVAMRNMPRIAVEPFMRVVGEMLDLEEEQPRKPRRSSTRRQRPDRPLQRNPTPLRRSPRPQPLGSRRRQFI